MKNYSFIIPHKNSLQLLKRCLASIPVRDDIEIIVVDDASDEQNIPIIHGSNIRIIRIAPSESKGAGHARNVGLEIATGKWILFADCDDFYEQSFMDELDKYVNSSYDYIVFDAYWAIDLQTGRQSWDFYKYILDNYLKDPQSKKKLNKVKHVNNSCWNKMISHAYLQRINTRFEEVWACNDGWFTQYIGIHTDNIAIINKKLYYYVMNSGSITTTKRSLSVQIQALRTEGKLHKYLEDHNVGYCNPPFFQGLKTSIRRNGFLRTLILYVLKIYFDVSLYKLLIHRINYNHR